MTVANAELLVELLSEAARTPCGRVGLLTARQVAEVLGRHRDWVHAHATRLGGFRLPESSEWRFAPRGVAQGLLDTDHGAHRSRQPLPSTSRRLAYPPAKQLLADRPRGAREGTSDASPGTRDD